MRADCKQLMTINQPAAPSVLFVGRGMAAANGVASRPPEE
jgi:hypothetical protein